MRMRIERVGLWLAAHVPHVPVERRYLHYCAGFLLGMAMIVFASHMADHGEIYTETLAGMPLVGVRIPRSVWDGFWFTVHAFGAVPFVAHAERLYHTWITFGESHHELQPLRRDESVSKPVDAETDRQRESGPA